MKQVSSLKSAMLYAQALYDGAGEKNELHEVYTQAREWADVLKNDSSLLNKLNNPLLKSQDKIKILHSLGSEFKLSSSLINTLAVMADCGKLNVVTLMLEQFIETYQKLHNIAQVEVTTVVPLTAVQEEKLKKKLKAIFNKEILLTYVIDPQIIGGLQLRYGTNFIDSCIKSKLNTLEQLMKGAK